MQASVSALYKSGLGHFCLVPPRSSTGASIHGSTGLWGPRFCLYLIIRKEEKRKKGTRLSFRCFPEVAHDISADILMARHSYRPYLAERQAGKSAAKN